jgi:ZIP family zinc transporter
MIDWLERLDPVLQALVAGTFTYSVTALGAAIVFALRSLPRRLGNGMLGFAGGVMLAASFFSLLDPAIELAEARGDPAWVPAAIGFLAGGMTLRGLDLVLPHLHPGLEVHEAEGPKTRWERSVLLVSAITLHNIPEGLAVGVAFGAVGTGAPGATTAAAVALAFGIALQNFPEGAAVSLPLRRDGMSRRRSFFFGQLSAVVEPIAAVIGAVAIASVDGLLPYALSFAAGAMVFVVIEELMPEAQRQGDLDLAAMALLIGFTVMMTLDVALA